MILVLLISLSSVSGMLGPKGGVLPIKRGEETLVSLSLPESAIDRSIPFEIKEVPPPPVPVWGWEPLRAYVVNPKWEVFKGPAELKVLLKKGEESAVLTYFSRDVFFPLASSKKSNGYLKASLYHGGTYVLMKPLKKLSLVAPEQAKYALLFVGDLLIDDSYPRMKERLKKDGYELPLWFFPLRPGETPEAAALRLSKELKGLHKKWGEFKLDVLAFGLGGLAANGYLMNSELYNKDFGNAFVAVGTPFGGSNLASIDSVLDIGKPYACYYLDVLGENIRDYLPHGPAIERLKKGKKGLHGGIYKPESLSSNVNFVNIRGKIPNSEGDIFLPELRKGDGLVSLASGKLTPIEPEPFPYRHFQLFKSKEVLGLAEEFLRFYHGWNWPLIFVSVWNGELPEDTICSLWIKEIKLHLRSESNLKALLEWNRNLLASVPPNGILITNGDYDTYPGWFLQMRENFRKDVLIVNRNICWVKSYVEFLKKKGLPLGEKELTVGDTLILNLVKKQDKRPVVFAVSVYKPQRFYPYLELRGLVFQKGKDTLNLEKTDSLLHKVYHYEAIRSIEADSLSGSVGRLVKNYQILMAEMAETLKGRGELGEAIEELDFATSFPTVFPWLWFTRGQLLEEMGKDKLAVESYTKALEASGDNWNLIIACSKPLLKMGKKAAVFKATSRYLYRHPEDKEAIKFLKSL